MDMSPPSPEPSNPERSWRGAALEERTEQQLAMLRRMAEIGMEMIELTRRQALEPIVAMLDGSAAPLIDPGVQYARLTRSVRRTLALEAKFVEMARARDRGEVPRSPPAGRPGDRARAAMARARGESERENLLSDWNERLDDDPPGKPAAEIVKEVCAELGMALKEGLFDEDVAAAAPAAARRDGAAPDVVGRPGPASPAKARDPP